MQGFGHIKIPNCGRKILKYGRCGTPANVPYSIRDKKVDLQMKRTEKQIKSIDSIQNQRKITNYDVIGN